MHASRDSATAFLAVAVLVCHVTAARAQSTAPPDVVARDDRGGITIRAVRLQAPLRLDGVLDEAIYQEVLPISGLIQNVPDEGAPSTERTEAWIMFDGDAVYVSAKCYDSAPPEQWTANEMRRDTVQLRQNDTFGVAFDTFYDRRNAFFFYANPLGGMSDQTLTDEGNANIDWNSVWDVRTGRFDGGWTLEMAIPFKTLRYKSGTDQTWGIQLRRVIRRKNEWTFLTAIPASAGTATGIWRASLYATLTGLDLPPASRNMELKPYAISRLTTDRLRTPPIDNDPDADIGVDFKYGVTANLTADITYNTDFAQVEVDEQQLNLTRFNLVFPEKREFFLEGRGFFDFARGAAIPGGLVGAGTASTPNLFYSRRIGLQRNRIVPIDAGGRLTGKVGAFGIGVLNIGTGNEEITGTPSTNFTVVRVKRDILRRSSIGAIFTNRSHSTVAAGSNQAYGLDAAFVFFENVHTGGFYARTETPGRSTLNASYQGRFDYAADRYGARAEYLVIGRNFNPEIGFLQRSDFKRGFGSLRFSPRPKASKRVRKYTAEGSLEYIENGAGLLETRQETGRFNVEFQNSDQVTVEAGRDYERLVAPFAIAPGVTIPAGRYQFSDVQFTFMMGQQRRISGSPSVQLGQFYDGTIAVLRYTAARVSVMRQFSIEPTVSINRVDLPAGRFTTTLYRARGDYAFSPRRFASALIQYSSADRAFSSNLRFRWEYRPGSELFVVYTDERDTLAPSVSSLKNRAFVIKINRLVRF